MEPLHRNKRLWQPNGESTKEREGRAAKAHGGRQVAGSGASPFSKKEDLITDRFLIQHKHTDGKSISVKLADLENLRHNAIDAEREPLFQLEYGRRNYYILTEEQYEEWRLATS